MSTAFLDLREAYRELKPGIDVAVQRVLDSGISIGGSEVTAFEHAYADYCGASHCVGVGNGLDALSLTLRALGVGPGDEVIVASNTFIATLLAVSGIGARPVLVEPDPATYNLDPARVEAAITEQTAVLLPTHLYGQPADLDPLLGIARRHGLRFVEDAAQAHGARYKGRRIGADGDAVTWSFYPGKNLGAMGDAGAVTTNDADIARRIRMLGNYGSSTKYVHEMDGVNSRLDPLQAAILGVKLDRLDEWNARRREISAYYVDQISNSDVILPFVPHWAEPSWHLFVVRTDRRAALQAALAKSGIQTLIHYPIPPHRQGAYADHPLSGKCYAVADRLADEALSIPIGPHLTRQSARAVVDAVNSFRRTDD